LTPPVATAAIVGLIICAENSGDATGQQVADTANSSCGQVLGGGIRASRRPRMSYTTGRVIDLRPVATILLASLSPPPKQQSNCRWQFTPTATAAVLNGFIAQTADRMITHHWRWWPAQ
jgi:hypothetical protein